MGDVGSGVLGLLIGIGVLRLLAVDAVEPASGMVACSAFVIDASCNLVSRIWRGRRWYSAHREHLYQWMVRSGMTHARVVAWYMGWNALVVVPTLWLLNRDMPAAASAALPIPEPDGIVGLFVVYGTGIVLWIFAKRWCLARVKSQRSHAPA
jgi:hypothetical protein